MSTQPQWINLEPLSKPKFLSEQELVSKVDEVEEWILKASDFDQEVVRIIVQFLACGLMVPGNFQNKKCNNIKLKILEDRRGIITGDYELYPAPEFKKHSKEFFESFEGYSRTHDEVFEMYPSIQMRQRLTLKFTERNFEIELERIRKRRKRAFVLVKTANPDLKLIKGDQLVSFAGISIMPRMSSSTFWKIWNDPKTPLPISIEFERVVSLMPHEICLKGYQNICLFGGEYPFDDRPFKTQVPVEIPIHPWEWERIDAQSE